jgi:hypothetical protein
MEDDSLYCLTTLLINNNIVLHLTLEILGLDPKITICKIAVLPVKLYPLKFMHKHKFKIDPSGDRTRAFNSENVTS